MCGEQTTTQQGATTSNTYQPAYLTQASKGITSSALNDIAGGYQGYTGPTTGAFGSTFGTAENSATARAATADPSFAAGQSALTQGLGLAGQTAGSSVSSLMSPYTSAALQPTLQAINQQAAATNQGAATNATMAGAFGDTGAAAQKALNSNNTAQQISDATGTAYNNAYQSALSTQQTALSQLFGGVGQASNLGSSSNSSATNLEALLGSLGSTTQQANQTGINTAVNVNNQNQMGGLQQLGLASGAIATAPHNVSQDGTSYGQTTQPDNTGLGLLGTLLGSASFNPAGSTSYGGYNYGSADLAQAAQAGVQGGLSFNPQTGEVV